MALGPRGPRGLGGGSRAGARAVRHAQAGPCALPAKPWRFSLTEGDGEEHDTPDLVNRDFTAGKPGEKMVGDITYISTWAGWFYLATVIDCYTKAVVGWAIDDNYKTPLIQRAIEMAARNHSLADKAIFHTDRGSNYMSGEFARTLKKLNVRHSVGRTGICPLTGQSQRFPRSATRRGVLGCLLWCDGGDTHVRHEHGGSLAAA